MLTCDRKVDITPGLAIKELCSLDDDEMGREVDPPGQGTGSYQNLADRNHKLVE